MNNTCIRFITSKGISYVIEENWTDDKRIIMLNYHSEVYKGVVTSSFYCTSGLYNNQGFSQYGLLI